MGRTFQLDSVWLGTLKMGVCDNDVQLVRYCILWTVRHMKIWKDDLKGKYFIYILSSSENIHSTEWQFV
jgi:hypothetical protein